jgi:hypothetical protein
MAVMRLSCLFVNGGASSTIRSMIAHSSSVHSRDAHSGLPMAQVKGAPMAECREGCGRVARSRGWCSSHYRLWRAGKPLDTPIRGYQRYEEGPDGAPIRASRAPSPRRKPPPPFAKEYALLRQLGLR